MTELVLATRNRDKIEELAHALHSPFWRVISVAQLGDWPEVEETGETLADNALLKARFTLAHAARPCLADDTGLEVDALDGAPGVRSSRYAGERVTYRDNVEKLLRDLAGVPEARRTARFRCVIALCDPDGRETCVEGVAEGRILTSPRGAGGFGYDPVFWVAEIGKTFAEMSLEEKSRMSHRGRAVEAAKEVLHAWYGGSAPGGKRAWQDSNLRPTD